MHFVRPVSSQKPKKLDTIELVLMHSNDRSSLNESRKKTWGCPWVRVKRHINFFFLFAENSSDSFSFWANLRRRLTTAVKLRRQSLTALGLRQYRVTVLELGLWMGNEKLSFEPVEPCFGDRTYIGPVRINKFNAISVTRKRLAGCLKAFSRFMPEQFWVQLLFQASFFQFGLPGSSLSPIYPQFLGSGGGGSSG